jgi:ketosteroid isomerase-like protein
MSQENVEIVRRVIAANRSGSPGDTVEKAMALTDPNCEFTSRLSSVDGTTYRGHDGIRAYFADLAEAFEVWRNELDEIGELGADAVFADLIFRATGRSGVDVELRSTVACVLSEGTIVSIHACPTRQEALIAAGLSE